MLLNPTRLILCCFSWNHTLPTHPPQKNKTHMGNTHTFTRHAVQNALRCLLKRPCAPFYVGFGGRRFGVGERVSYSLLCREHYSRLVSHSGRMTGLTILHFLRSGARWEQPRAVQKSRLWQQGSSRVLVSMQSLLCVSFTTPPTSMSPFPPCRTACARRIASSSARWLCLEMGATAVGPSRRPQNARATFLADLLILPLVFIVNIRWLNGRSGWRPSAAHGLSR